MKDDALLVDRASIDYIPFPAFPSLPRLEHLASFPQLPLYFHSRRPPWAFNLAALINRSFRESLSGLVATLPCFP